MSYSVSIFLRKGRLNQLLLGLKKKKKTQTWFTKKGYSIFFGCPVTIWIWVKLNLCLHHCHTVQNNKQNTVTDFGLPLFRHCSMVFFVNSCTFLYFCIKLSINWLAWTGVIPKQSARRSLPGGTEVISIMQ